MGSISDVVLQTGFGLKPLLRPFYDRLGLGLGGLSFGFGLNLEILRPCGLEKFLILRSRFKKLGIGIRLLF